jgi:hypothetical protein
VGGVVVVAGQMAEGSAGTDYVFAGSVVVDYYQIGDVPYFVG